MAFKKTKIARRFLIQEGDLDRAAIFLGFIFSIMIDSNFEKRMGFNLRLESEFFV